MFKAEIDAHNLDEIEAESRHLDTITRENISELAEAVTALTIQNNG